MSNLIYTINNSRWYLMDTRDGKLTFKSKNKEVTIADGNNILDLLAKEVFDIDVFKIGLFEVLTNRIIDLSPYYAVLIDLLNFHNFNGAINYAKNLLNTDIITPTEYDAILQLLSNQSINIIIE